MVIVVELQSMDSVYMGHWLSRDRGNKCGVMVLRSN
jgi:hypothetical protein